MNFPKFNFLLNQKPKNSAFPQEETYKDHWVGVWLACSRNIREGCRNAESKKESSRDEAQSYEPLNHGKDFDSYSEKFGDPLQDFEQLRQII